MKLVNLSSVVELTQSVVYKFISVKHNLLDIEKLYFYDGNAVIYNPDKVLTIDNVTGFNTRFDCVNGKRYNVRTIYGRCPLSGVTCFNLNMNQGTGK